MLDFQLENMIILSQVLENKNKHTLIIKTEVETMTEKNNKKMTIKKIYLFILMEINGYLMESKLIRNNNQLKILIIKIRELKT
jgi:hypothetical protein